MRLRWTAFLAPALAALLAGCSGGGPGDAGPGDPGPEAIPDVPGEADVPPSDEGVAPDGTPGDPAADGPPADPGGDPDLPGDVPGDLPPDGIGDLPADAAPDLPDVPWVAPFDPSACGAAPHAWIPPSEVGRVVSWAPTDAYPELPGDLVRAMAEAADGGKAHPELVYGSRNFNLRYTTQDRGVEVEATAVVGIPWGVPEGVSPPLALFLHGTTGFTDACAPSRKEDGALAVTLLSALGYLTVAPDYLGLRGFGDPSPEGNLHAYMVAEPVALASLDAARAALQAVALDAEAPVPDPSRTVVWGGSQGGHAAFMVDRYAPHYRPEIALAAVVAFVPVTDLTGHAQFGATHFGDTGLTMAAALTAMRHWYGRPDDMTPVLTDREPHFLASSLAGWMADGCGAPGEVKQLTSLDQVYTPDFLAKASAGLWDDLDPWGCYLRANSVQGTPVPRRSDVPFLATYGERDGLVVTPVELQNMERLCGEGYRIEVLECQGADHTSGIIEMVPIAQAWTQARLRGDPWDPAKVCRLAGPVDCKSGGER